MGFAWGEIKKWADGHNLKPKKIKTGGYEWECKSYQDLDNLVVDLWNLVSKNKWIDYQKKYYEKISTQND